MLILTLQNKNCWVKQPSYEPTETTEWGRAASKIVRREVCIVKLRKSEEFKTSKWRSGSVKKNRRAGESCKKESERPPLG
jgi:hypothetical protein